jgi:hypothetical protein
MFPLMFVDPFCACAGKARRAKAKLKVTSRVIFILHFDCWPWLG